MKLVAVLGFYFIADFQRATAIEYFINSRYRCVYVHSILNNYFNTYSVFVSNNFMSLMQNPNSFHGNNSISCAHLKKFNCYVSPSMFPNLNVGMVLFSPLLF